MVVQVLRLLQSPTVPLLRQRVEYVHKCTAAATGTQELCTPDLGHRPSPFMSADCPALGMEAFLSQSISWIETHSPTGTRTKYIEDMLFRSWEYAKHYLLQLMVLLPKTVVRSSLALGESSIRTINTHQCRSVGTNDDCRTVMFVCIEF